MTNLVPDNSICFIQAPSIEEGSALHSLLMPSEFPYYYQVILSTANNETLINIIKDEKVEGYFQSLEIRHDGELYFEGYGGMEYGTISKDITRSRQFFKRLYQRGYVHCF